VGSRAARHARAARHRAVGSPGTVAVCGLWATGQRCTAVALQPPLSTRLIVAWCLLVVRRLRRCAHAPRRDHDGHAQGISVTLIARRPLGLQGTRGDPGAARAGQRELSPQDTWWPRSCPGPVCGGWIRRTRGGPGAAPGWVAGARAAGHVAAPELPWEACVAARGYTPCSLP
jgi:hypothetical protein